MILRAPLKMQLRHVRDDDHEWLVELHNDPSVLHNMIDNRSITLEHHMAWWAGISKDPRQLRLIFTVNDERVGFTKFYNIDQVNHNCVLGGDIHKDHRGKGYAKYMWQLMLNHCFIDLNLHRVALATAVFNEPGQRTYCRVGFKEEGRQIDVLYRDGKYHDGICMYMLRSDWEAKQ